MTTGDGCRNAYGKVHMIVLQQDHVEQTNTMVHTATDLHGFLLQHTHARSGLAGVEDAGLGTLQTGHILAGHGGDTAHALHDVQHQTLCLQQTLDLSGNNHGHIARFHMRTVLNEHLNLQGRVKTVKNLLGDFNTGQNTFFLDEQLGFTHRVFRNTTQSGVVAVTNIFSKSQIDQTIIQFVYSKHLLFFWINIKFITKIRKIAVECALH